MCPELAFLQLYGPIWGWREIVSTEVFCLCPVYSIISFWLLSLQKALLQKKQGVENGSILFIAFVTVSGYSMLILIQNLWRFEVVSNILLRPSSFPISRSWSFSSTDKADSPGLFTNGSRTHSSHLQGILWLVSKAQILLKTGISDHAPAGKSVGFWLKACHRCSYTIEVYQFTCTYKACHQM